MVVVDFIFSDNKYKWELIIITIFFLPGIFNAFWSMEKKGQ